jgi:subtilisin family serine protease
MMILALALILSAGTVQAVQAPGTAGKISRDVIDKLAKMRPRDSTTVIVRFKDQADLAKIQGINKRERMRRVIAALRAKAAAWPPGIEALLQRKIAEGRVLRAISYWVFNGISITATADTIVELAESPQVESISSDETDIVPLAPAAPAEYNLSVIGAPALWNQGYTGQGIVVASMDTGVDLSHPELAQRWRGGSNSWYDPYGQQAAPTDPFGHGTWTMGVMVGGDAGGTSIGVAPGAQWIAVRIFSDAGSTTATAIHNGFQWLLDPDGDPNTDDAPDVVNNSWGFLNAGSCNLTFQTDLQALRQAGILPVFAAGNSGPGPSTSVSPANNPEAFAVGAIDNTGQIYDGSSRGPSACTGVPVYPALVAPGVLIKSTGLNGTYSLATGTSLAAPHVSGSLALLLGACPNLTVDQQEQALRNSAADLGVAGPDSDFGFGVLDVQAALSNLTQAGLCNPAPPSLTLSCALETGQVGTLYASTIPVSGGTPPYRFSVTGLPPGLTVDSLTGTITGTPASVGTYSYTATVTDADGLTATMSCSITVVTAPLALACPCGTGEVGINYTSSLGASGGTPPYCFSIQTGSLPPGLVLNPATGAIDGEPRTAGTFTYTAAVTDSAGQTATVTCAILIGTGTAPPTVVVSPDSLTFAPQLVGTTSAPQTATLSNAGSSPLSLPHGSIALEGLNPGAFVLTENCLSQLKPGASCTVSVRFRPTRVGAWTARVSIKDGQASVALTGTGTAGAISLSTTALTFSSPLNVPSASQQVIVRNTGTAPVTISAFPLSGANPAQFRRTEDCPAVLAIDATCTITVTFEPSVASPLTKNALLTVNAAAPATDASITLTGAIIVPAYSVTPSPVDFGMMSIAGGKSAPRTVTIRNTGQAPVVFSGFTISGPNSGQFSRTLLSCRTGGANALPPGMSCTINVSFNPSNPAGLKKAQLNVNVAAPAAGRSVLLSGVGVMP